MTDDEKETLLRRAAHELQERTGAQKLENQVFRYEEQLHGECRRGPVCPVCFSRKIEVVGLSEIVLQDQFGKIALDGEAQTLPVVIAVCDQCGYVLRFSAKKLKVL